MKHALLFILFAGSSSPACAAERATPVEPESPAVLSVQSLAADAHRYLGRTVRVRGTLENAGSNFFTDLRVRLRDDVGQAIAVQPWLPTSVPPGPKAPGATAPKTLSSFLGKRVELVAEVSYGEMGRQGELYYLKVKSAQVVP